MLWKFFYSGASDRCAGVLFSPLRFSLCFVGKEVKSISINLPSCSPKVEGVLALWGKAIVWSGARFPKSEVFFFGGGGRIIAELVLSLQVIKCMICGALRNNVIRYSYKC